MDTINQETCFLCNKAVDITICRKACVRSNDDNITIWKYRCTDCSQHVRLMLRTMKSVEFINWFNKLGDKTKGLSLRECAKIYLGLSEW